MQYEADSLLHSTTCHIKALYQISQAVPEKSLTEDMHYM